MTAATGVYLATAPDVAHYLPFLQGLLTAHPIAVGVATIFAPAVVSTAFICLALYIIHGAVIIPSAIAFSYSPRDRRSADSWLSFDLWKSTPGFQDHVLRSHSNWHPVAYCHRNASLFHERSQHWIGANQDSREWLHLHGGSCICFSAERSDHLPSPAFAATIPAVARSSSGETSYHATTTFQR